MKQSLYQQMLTLQDKCNRTVDVDWITRGRNWGRALRQEAAEGIDSCPWKWWKKGELDVANLEVELIDIFHFILSMYIEGKKTPADLMFAVEEGYAPGAIQFQQKDQYDAEAIMQAVERMVRHSWLDTAADYVEVAKAWGFAWASLGKPLESLYNGYVVKNVLNIFRQDNGYKDGTYVKEWKRGKGEPRVEDNVVAFEISKGLIESLAASNSLDQLPAQLQSKLHVEYQDTLKAKIASEKRKQKSQS